MGPCKEHSLLGKRFIQAVEGDLEGHLEEGGLEGGAWALGRHLPLS